MDWIDNKHLQLTLDILWNSEGVSMQDWRDCSTAIEAYYGMSADYEMQCKGKNLVIQDMQTRIEQLEKENLILTTKYTEAKNECINLGIDIKDFEDVGKLVKDYLESKATVQDMDGNTIYEEPSKDED